MLREQSWCSHCSLADKAGKHAHNVLRRRLSWGSNKAQWLCEQIQQPLLLSGSVPPAQRFTSQCLSDPTHQIQIWQ